jgi:hypothetical protein
VKKKNALLWNANGEEVEKMDYLSTMKEFIIYGFLSTTVGDNTLRHRKLYWPHKMFVFTRVVVNLDSILSDMLCHLYNGLLTYPSSSIVPNHIRTFLREGSYDGKVEWNHCGNKERVLQSIDAEPLSITSSSTS